MKPLRPGVDVDAFLRSLEDAPGRILMLDYDGCLAPFRQERDRAVPYPGLRERLEALRAAGHTRLIVVTGRALDAVVPLLGIDPPPEIWGAHGWERLRADGSRDPPPLRPDARRALAAARDDPAVAELGERVEDKPASVAVHVRGMPAREAEALIDRVSGVWRSHGAGAGLEVHAFDGGIELRVPGRDKGTAVREALNEGPPGAVAAYLGDDLTDEDAFAALDGRGLSVLVRPEWRETRADVWLRPPDELLAFLDRWHAAARRSVEPTSGDTFAPLSMPGRRGPDTEAS